MSKWQPIETAPKDGTVILGFEDMYFPMLWVHNRWELSGVVWCDGSDEVEPTHWMPLPNPPTELNGI